MARITYDGQCFHHENRRLWLVGAGIDYARVPATLWAERIAAAKQAGFNTILVNCPWLVHEPRKGRFVFNGQADVRAFVSLCVKQGLFVGLKVGPYVGAGYDGGGLPSWLSEVEGIAMREANGPYLERAGQYLRKLIQQFVEFQTDKIRAGGVVFVQAEHGWMCSKDDVADAYLGELEKHIRENGITVPILNANGFWAEGRNAIETWVGFDDLLVNLRQMRLFQPDAPRIVSAFPAAEPNVWGDPVDESRHADAILYNAAQTLAAGAQPIVSTFHGGTNFGFLGGRLAGRDDGFITTALSLNAPLGEAGARSRKYDAIKRIATFANHFGYVFAELDPDYHPVTVSLDHIAGENGAVPAAPGARGVSVVPLRGAQGRAVFVFGDPVVDNQISSLLLDDGVPLSLNLGDQAVGWYLIDVDLGGVGRLNHANLCPFALVDRSILVMFGPEKMEGQITINESLVEVVVPSGQKPRVVDHQGVTLVICNEAQVDATYIAENRVYVGACGLDLEGRPLAHPDFQQVTIIDKERGTTSEKPEQPAARAAATKLDGWLAAPAQSQASGDNPRFASLAGPATLDACGTPAGYGWYRVRIKSNSARKRLCAVPQLGNRLHLYLDGEAVNVLGTGPGAVGYFTELKLGKGEHTIVGLADHTGRFSEGNDFGRMKGWFGHMYEVKPLKVSRPKIVEYEPVDPFTARHFIIGQSQGRMMSEVQAVWTFTHRKKSLLLVQVDACAAPGVFLLNDEPLAFYAGETGEQAIRFLVNPSLESFKRGGNELRFAPDPDYENAAEAMADALTVYECVENLTESASWGFARWEQPAASAYTEVGKTEARSLRGTPSWWRITFEPRSTTLPRWLDTRGLSKGVAFLNGENLGRYFTATADGRKVGPQTRLYMPESWFKTDGSPDELVIFDEHGFDPSKTKIVYGLHGEFEGP